MTPLPFFVLFSLIFSLSSSLTQENGEQHESDMKIKELFFPVHWVMECGCTGMHLEAMSFVQQLYDMGVEITVNDCGTDFCLPSSMDLLEKISRQKYPDKKSIIILHYAWKGVCALPNPDEYDPSRHYIVSRSMFEASRIDEDAVQRCNSHEISTVLLPSHFSEEAFVLSGVSAKKVELLPEIINTSLFSPYFEMTNEIQENIDHLLKHSNNIFDPEKTLFGEENSEKKIFLSVFKFETRKNWQDLVLAFAQLYQERQDIILLLKTKYYAGLSPVWGIRFFLFQELGITDDVPIYILSSTLTEVEMRNLYFLSNYFVLPTRGEGWGLPIMEAMSMELPTITTNFGGQTTFAKEDNTFLIPVKSFSPAFEEEGEYLSGIGEWANPSLFHLHQHMHFVLSFPLIAKRRGERAREGIVKEWGEERTVGKLVEFLGRVSREMEEGGGCEGRGM